MFVNDDLLMIVFVIQEWKGPGSEMDMEEKDTEVRGCMSITNFGKH